MVHILCSCGALLTSMSGLDHFKKNPSHHEVRRWTFPIEGKKTKLTEQEKEKRRHEQNRKACRKRYKNNKIKKAFETFEKLELMTNG